MKVSLEQRKETADKNHNSYLFVESQRGCDLVFVLEEHCTLQSKLWNEDNDGILSHKKDETFFIQNTSALEKQLK